MGDIEQALRAAMTMGAPTPAQIHSPAYGARAAEPGMAWPSAPSAASVKTAVKHPAFRAFAVFVIAAILLVVTNPPFVNAPSEGERNALEEPPCSYGRVMVCAGVFAGLVLLVPLCLKHKSKFESGFNTVKGWVDKAKAATANK